MKTVKMIFALLIFYTGLIDLVSICFAQSPWTQKADMINIRQAHSSGVLDGKIYVIGGVQYNTSTTHYNAIKSVEFYDPVTDTWDTTKTDMNTGRCQFPSCVYDGKIWAIGGGQSIYWDPLKSIEVYDPDSDTWTRITDMPRPRMGHTAALVNGKIYIVGGADSNDLIPIPEIDVYDPQTNTWDTTKANIITPRMWLRSAVLNGIIYVIGGHLGLPGGELTVKILEAYDPTTDMWEAKADMPWPNKSFSVCVLDEKIYVFGGASGYCGGVLSTVEAYDPTTNTWTARTDIPNVWTLTAAASLNGKAYVSGGTMPVCPPSVQKTFREYNPDKDVLTTRRETGSFEFEGLERKYEVYLPAELKENMPLILSLHGYSEDFQWYRNYTQLNLAIDTAGYVLVCPQAINLTWNIGILEDPDGIRDFNGVKDVNDVEFISTLIDTICNNYSIDIKRIYCCGFSTGGEMSLVLASCLGYRFAAVASVAGGLYDPAALWHPCKPMPVLEIHGTSESRYSPYDGRGSMWSVAKTLNYWVERNKITDPPDTVLIPDIVTSDNCTVVKFSYTGGLNESEVIHYRVVGGGHSWPDSKTSFGTEGNKNLDISANSEILKFFNKFENPYYDIANPKSFDISPKYIRPEGDTLTITANLVNPENHSVAVYGIITGEEQDFEDSLQLFDDGLHNDVNAFDNIFGGSKWLTGLEEDFYKLKIRATDLEDSLTSYSHFNYTKYFTTAGPLTVDSIAYSDLLDFKYGIKPIIKNNGTTVPISDIQVKIFSDDPWVIQVGPESQTCPNISPGEIKTVSRNFTVNYDSATFPGYFNLKFEISSNGIPYWTDSIQTTVVQSIWTRKADMHIARGSHSSCVLDGKVYVIGGKESDPNLTLKSMEIYDPATDTWDNTKSDMIEARVIFSCCAIDGKILAIGGSQEISSGPIGSIEEYDPVMDSWTHKTNMPNARIGLAASLVNHKIYIFGGTDVAGVLIPDVDVYDLITGTWTRGKNLPTPRSNLYSVELDGKIYVIGGTFGASNGYLGLGIVEMYDPETDIWSTQADMITSRKNFTACTFDGKIYVFGGSNLDCGGILSSVEVYDPLIDSWEERTNIPSILGGPSAVSLNGRAYVSGGTIEACPGNTVKTMYEYNPAQDTIVTEIIDEHNRQQPKWFTLCQNYPNPFNPITKIKYQIPERSFVTLKVYDVLGEELTTLVNEEKPTGTYEVTWNGENLSSGVYFYQLRSGDFIETKKMVLLR